MELKIPPLPNTLGEVLQIMSAESPTGSVDRLVALIRRDPATSIYVLRRINSPYHGVRRYISQLDQAVVLLGFKRVCNLVLAATLKQTFAYLESTAACNIYEHVMQMSLATAAFARDLAAHLRLPFSETAFTAGLLHQLGRLVFLQSASQTYTSLWYQPAPDTGQLTFTPPTPTREEDVFNTTYPRLGAAVMKQWSFPKELIVVTGSVLHPSQVIDGQTRRLTLTVAAGNALAAPLFNTNGKDAPAAFPQLPISVMALARDSHLDVQALAGFLAERRAVVREFAETVFKDM